MHYFSELLHHTVSNVNQICDFCSNVLNLTKEINKSTHLINLRCINVEWVSLKIVSYIYVKKWDHFYKIPLKITICGKKLFLELFFFLVLTSIHFSNSFRSVSADSRQSNPTTSSGGTTLFCMPPCVVAVVGDIVQQNKTDREQRKKTSIRTWWAG